MPPLLSILNASFRRVAMSSKFTAAGLVAGAALLAACATSKPVGATMNLAATQWVAEDIAGAAPVEQSRVSLRFSADRVSGGTGCNQYFAVYRVNGGTLSVSGIGSTKMACAPALMGQESAYLGLLGAAASYAYDRDGLLVITTRDGKTMRFRPTGS
jgi:heat shock protein HslJ